MAVNLDLVGMQSSLKNVNDPEQFADMIGRTMNLQRGDADWIYSSLSTAKDLEAIDAPTPSKPPMTRMDMMAKMRPPPTPEAVETSKAEAKSLITKLKEDPSALQAIAMFGAQLAQGPQKGEQGIAGMMGRAIETGLGTYAKGQAGEAARATALRQEARENERLRMERERLGLETARVGIEAEKADRTPKVGGDFMSQAKALQKELQMLNPALKEKEAFAQAVEIYSAYQNQNVLARNIDPYATAEEVATMEAQAARQRQTLGDMVRSATGNKATPAPEAPTVPAAAPTASTPILDTILESAGALAKEAFGKTTAVVQKGLEKAFPREKEIDLTPPAAKGKIERGPTGEITGLPSAAPATAQTLETASRAPTEALNAENYWVMLMRANNQPQPGSMKYNQLMVAMQELFPGFDPQSAKGQIRR